MILSGDEHPACRGSKATVLSGDEHPAWKGSKRRITPRVEEPSIKDIKESFKDVESFKDGPCKETPTSIELEPILTPKRSEKEEIKQSLREGVNIMREFNWNYPPPSATDGARDDATKGFKILLSSVTRLITALEKCDRHQAGKYLSDITDDFESDWPNVLHFLATMGVQKRTFISQIKYVTLQLIKLLPAFAEAAEFAQLQLNFQVDRAVNFEGGFSADPLRHTPGQISQHLDVEQRLSEIARLKIAGCFDIDRTSTVSRMTTPGRYEFERLEEMSNWTMGSAAHSLSDMTHIQQSTPRLPLRQIGDSHGSEAVVAKNGWRRSALYDTDRAESAIGKLADGTVVRVIDDDGTGEYVKVEVVCWMKRSYLQPSGDV